MNVEIRAVEPALLSLAQERHAGARLRPVAWGKFLWRGGEKVYLKGVTYGPLAAEPDEYGTPAVVQKDFAAMAAASINTVRVYTVPPQWLLDKAAENGLLVMVGLAWEQHVTFLDDRAMTRSIVDRVRTGVRGLRGHPALAAITVGNEIPASIVRWHGPKRIEAFLRQLYQVTKEEDPKALVTYVNFPTTEYLDISFFDFACFNVYLETEERLAAYLARLQNLAGDKPLVLAEAGLDSRRNGELRQAEALGWQIRTAFRHGTAGTFAFAWTDEWHRGGFEITDWDFGLTTREREPKPALHAVRAAFADAPVSRTKWPKFSVVVCSYNGSRTIRDTLDYLARLDYPAFETIVISDGSTDDTAAIAREYSGVRVIETSNHGLSAARNRGMREASGEIIAYIDDDAYPDFHWLHYLAETFLSGSFVAAGGPNLPPPRDGYIAECVARSPGGPVHVLLTDEIAEHIPGCNFAVRKSALEAIGGFDPIYRAAGDDVDACWRLQAAGGAIGFHPAAVVWHHHRNSIKAYVRQQIGYGKAEALLESKWPEKYNAVGHLAWNGRVYSAGNLRPVGLVNRIYHGVWNMAPFQSLYEPPFPEWQAWFQTPEWYLVNFTLLVLVLLGFVWRPLLWAAPVLALSTLVPLAQVIAAVTRTHFSTPSLRVLAVGLYVIQPLARLHGRLTHGLTPWRRSPAGPLRPWGFAEFIWSESWHEPAEWLAMLDRTIRSSGLTTKACGEYENWDLDLRGGLFGVARLRLAVEDHSAGKQLLRWRGSPHIARAALAVIAILIGLAVAAAMDRSWTVAAVLTAGGGGLLLRSALECSRALGYARSELKKLAAGS